MASYLLYPYYLTICIITKSYFTSIYDYERDELFFAPDHMSQVSIIEEPNITQLPLTSLHKNQLLIVDGTQMVLGPTMLALKDE